MSHPDAVAPGWLQASQAPLIDMFDVALLDLDGTLYRGTHVVPQAPEVVAALRKAGARPAFVTNNASRPPAAVVEHLSALGFTCDVTEVMTAAQAGAALVAARVPPGSAVLVVGGSGVRQALLERGLRPVDRADNGPVAVLQGWAPDLSWTGLAEGAFALAAGLPWIVTNTDLTLPTDRGIAPGNGSFVALLATVSGRSPDAVAGKPMTPLLEQAIAKLSAQRPIAVGDRLDTDIAGAGAVSVPSLLVLSGVTDLRALLQAGPTMRPTVLAGDVTGLLRAHRGAQISADGTWSCGRWTARCVHDPRPDGPTAGRPRLELTRDQGAAPDQNRSGPSQPRQVLISTADGDGLDPVRAAAAAMWASADHGVAADAGDDLISELERASGQPVSRSTEQRP